VAHDSGKVDLYQREVENLVEKPLRSLVASSATGKSIRAADVVRELERVQADYEKEIRAEMGKILEQHFMRDPKRWMDIIQQIQQNLRNHSVRTTDTPQQTQASSVIRRTPGLSEIQQKMSPEIQVKMDASVRLANLIQKVRGWQRRPLPLDDLRSRMRESLRQDQVAHEKRIEEEKREKESEQQLRQAEEKQQQLLQQQMVQQEQEKVNRKQQRDREREREEYARKRENNLNHPQAADLFANTLLFYVVLERLQHKLQESEAKGRELQQQLKENETLHKDLQQQLKKNHKECNLHREQLKEKLVKDPENGEKLHGCHQELKELKKERKQLKRKQQQNVENAQKMRQKLQENKEKQKQLQQKLHQNPELQRLSKDTKERKRLQKNLQKNKSNHKKLQQQLEENQAECRRLRKLQHELQRDPTHFQKWKEQLREFYPDHSHVLDRESRGQQKEDGDKQHHHRHLDKDDDRCDTYYPTRFEAREHVLDLLER
jgi:hypothetical protein